VPLSTRGACGHWKFGTLLPRDQMQGWLRVAARVVLLGLSVRAMRTYGD
jgi:hypothetical protein